MRMPVFTKKFYENPYHAIIDCLVAALEAKDAYTAGHSSKVAGMAHELAWRLGIRGKQLEEIHIAAHLHDIGKIGIPEQILNKKEVLLPHERRQVEEHPRVGYEILAQSKYLLSIAKIVLHHHERWDGKGYPAGLQGERIPLGSRVIAVADTVDAMTSDRPYRQAMGWPKCRLEIEAQKGCQFDPIVVEGATGLWPEWEKQALLRAKQSRQMSA